MTQEERFETEFEAFNQKRMLNSEGYPPEQWFKAGWEAALRNQWISVDEVLPELYRNVLVIFDDLHIINASFDGEYWWWNDGFPVGVNSYGDAFYSSQQCCEDKPTHWMAIPKLGGEQ